MHLLLMRAFPGWYKFNSTYAMFPFSVPSKTKEVQTKLDTISYYDFTPPAPPSKGLVLVKSYESCIKVLNDQEHFKMGWGPGIKGLTGGTYMLSGDGKEFEEMHARLHRETVGVEGAEKAIWDYYVEITDKLIKTTSFQIGNYFEMDAVRE